MGLELLLLLLLRYIGRARIAVKCAVWASQQWHLIPAPHTCCRAFDSTKGGEWRASISIEARL